MKKIIQVLLLTIAIFTSHFSQAQTAEEIVEKYISKIGGRQKLSSINTIIYSGTQDYYGTFEFIVITEAKEALQRYDIEIDGQKGVWMTTTEFGGEYFPWKINKVYSSPYRKLPPQSFKLLDRIITYKEDSSRIVFLGKFKLDSAFGYKIQLTTKKGIRKFYWFDETTFLLRQSSLDYSMRTSQNDRLPTIDINKFSNWQSVDGMMFPFTKMTEVVVNNKIAAKKILYLSSIKINASISPDLYHLNIGPVSLIPSDSEPLENVYSE